MFSIQYGNLDPAADDKDGGSDAGEILLSICSFLSATVVVNSFFFKAPQIYAILNSGSSSGISLTSVTLEWIAYSIMLTYHYAMHYPSETYLEVILQVMQDFMLIVLILFYRQLISWKVVPYFLIYFTGFSSIALKWLPDTMMTASIASTTLILCWSKVDQLVEILWTQDPGSLSALSWFFAVYDTAVRILTTIVITKDMPMFINLTSSEVLNVAIFSSILYYNHKKRQPGWKPLALRQ